MYNLCFYGIRTRFKAIPVGFRFSVFLSIQTLINITLLRNVMLTAPFGAWATCAFCRSISAKELLMVSPKEDSTSFLAALLMSGTCNYSFLLSSVNSLIY